MTNEIEKTKEKDFLYNRVSSSRFVFYVIVFCILAWSLGGAYKLYSMRYMGKPDIEIQGSSKYTPDYK